MSAVALPSLSPALERVRGLFEARPVKPVEIAALQRSALERFLELGLPTTRDEAWKYTNLRRLESRAFTLPEAVAAVDPDLSTRLLDAAAWQRLVFVNGSFAPAQSTLASETGIRIRSLQAILRETPDEGAALLGNAEATTSARFELLNRAFVEDGLVIDIDASVVFERPLYIVFQSTGAGRPWMISPRVIVRAGSHSRLTLIEHHVSAERAEHFVNVVTHVSLAEGATVEHYLLQQEGAQVIHLGHLHAEIGRNARFISHTQSLGGSLARLDLSAKLLGEGANTELNGVFLANGTQHLDTHSCIEHISPHTQSTEDYRGLADGRGRGVFNGKVIVHPDAQKTDARQSSRNLILSPSAEIDTRPELEIYADDVKCSHGATTGQIDQAALFYLRSRGISEEDARGLLILAFVEAVITRMPLEPVQAHLRQIFRQHFLQSAGVQP